MMKTVTFTDTEKKLLSFFLPFQNANDLSVGKMSFGNIGVELAKEHRIVLSFDALLSVVNSLEKKRIIHRPFDTVWLHSDFRANPAKLEQLINDIKK